MAPVPSGVKHRARTRKNSSPRRPPPSDFKSIFYCCTGINVCAAWSLDFIRTRRGDTPMESREVGRAGMSRRRVLECMTWAGTGVLWTIAGGVPRSLGIVDGPPPPEAGNPPSLKTSDSPVGSKNPANPNVIGTLEEAIGKVKALPVKPSFMIHTGDITHLSKPAEFDNADRI